ncbi:MAG: hypothetical protein ACC656_06825, partial [Candidatus Heimdallarchaeota archaeon]
MKLLTINPKLTLTTMLIILFLSSITAASTFSESVKRNNAGNSNIETQATPNVLILYSENIQFVTQIENNFTSFGFTTSTLDMQSYTPTIAELTPYDVIFAWTDFSISDSIGVGNVLADYIDAGGSLIISSGLFSPGYNVTGRFQSDGY